MAAGLLLLAIPAALASYAGHWTLVPGESGDVKSAVEAAVSKMSFLIRPIARSRLEKTQIAFSAIDIEYSETEFVIRHKGGTAVPHRGVDETVNAVAPDGAKIRVGLIAGPPLREIYTSSEGSRTNTYT